MQARENRNNIIEPWAGARIAPEFDYREQQDAFEYLVCVIQSLNHDEKCKLQELCTAQAHYLQHSSAPIHLPNSVTDIKRE